MSPAAPPTGRRSAARGRTGSADHSPNPPRPVRVECYAGYRGEETPRRIRLANRWLEIAEIVDRWLAPDHRYFRVRAEDGDILVLRHETASQRWELLSA
jgi:hypothetical protein